MTTAGVLLAAGRAERFGGAKLLVPVGGIALGLLAYRNLRQALDDVVAVVRPGDRVLAQHYEDEGARVVVAERADEGMGSSLAAGIAAIAPNAGVIVALADMPWISPATIRSVAEAIAVGASIAAPRYRGQRGHPVGFAGAHRPALLALRGDEGARPILAAHHAALTLIDVDDPGVLRDVDTREDLPR